MGRENRHAASKLITRSVVLASAGLLAVGGMASSAKAALSLTLSEVGFAPFTVSDIGEGTPGTVVDFAPYGDFSTNIIIGSDNANSGPSTVGQMQIQSVDVHNNAPVGKTITITLSESNFTFPGTVGQSLLLTSGLGGTLTLPGSGDTIAFQSTATPSSSPAVSTANNSFSTNASAAVAGVVTFAVPTGTANFTETGSYALSSIITATLSSAGETANLSGSATVSAVPEPMSLSVVGLLAAGCLGRRRNRA